MSLHEIHGADHQKRDVRNATKIIALIRRAGLSQAEIARRYGVGRRAINRTIWGTRSGARLRTAIANELGFATWAELKAERVTL